MKRYWKYIKPYLPAFILGPILMIIEVIGEVVLPKLMANIINIGAANHDVSYITGMGGAMLGVAAFMIIGGIGGAYFAAKASISFSSALRSDVFDKVQKFSFSNLEQFSTSSLVTRMTNDITQVQNLINMALRMMLRAPGMLVGALFMAFMMNFQLALVVLVVIPVLILLIAIVIKTAFPRFEIMQKKLDTLNSNIQEVLTNVRVIRSFVREEHEKQRFAASNEELKQSSLNAFKVVILNMPIMMFMMNATTLGVVWFGGKQILAGTMPVGDLTAFTTYIVQILMSLMMLAMVLLQSSRALASFRRIVIPRLASFLRIIISRLIPPQLVFSWHIVIPGPARFVLRTPIRRAFSLLRAAFIRRIRNILSPVSLCCKNRIHSIIIQQNCADKKYCQYTAHSFFIFPHRHHLSYLCPAARFIMHLFPPEKLFLQIPSTSA